MIDLTPDFVIESTLEVGTIYKLEASEIIDTIIPHYFIVVGIDGSDNYLVLCTSQKQAKEDHFNNQGLDFEGLVYIKPDSTNCLTQDTYVNCNDSYTISKTLLIEKVKLGKLNYTGKVSLNNYDQIRTGIISSYINDLPEDLLKYPGE